MKILKGLEYVAQKREKLEFVNDVSIVTIVCAQNISNAL
jgi:hypothetical protein